MAALPPRSTTDEVTEMYVLEATGATQGDRDDDYVWTIDGELVFVPLLECPDPYCGCDRGFAGTTSHRATTTAVVVERPDLEPAGYRAALVDAMCEQGYDIGGRQPVADLVEELVAAVQALGGVLGAGTVIERSGPRLSVRRPGSCQTP